MSHRDTVAALIFLGGGLHFKAIEGPALLADSDHGEVRPDFPVEAVFVHGKEAWGITKSHESGEKGWIRSGNAKKVVGGGPRLDDQPAFDWSDSGLCYRVAAHDLTTLFPPDPCELTRRKGCERDKTAAIRELT